MTPLVIPPGFVEQRIHQQTWWLKIGWETVLQEILAQTRAVTPHLTTGGRGATQRVHLGERGTAIIRQYRRGGWVRRFIRDVYWDRPPRPLAELICTETAHRRGIPTVEVLGAGMERVTLGLYRGVLITREAEGFVNLWEWLRSKPTAPQREAVAAATARVIAQLHAVGIEHPDLNLTNILVRTATDMPTVLVIDFDRARLLPGPLPPRRRTRNLHRLRRSLNKLDPEGQFCSATDLQIFCQGYHTWYSEHG